MILEEFIQMEFNIGDRIKYTSENGNGSFLKGEIVDIWKNNKDAIIGYFATLDSGIFVHIQPDSLKWCKIEEPSRVN
jgi:hypothetical protein